MNGHTLVDKLNYAPLLTGAEASRKRRRGLPIMGYVGANGSGKSLLLCQDTIPTLQGIPWVCDNPDHLHSSRGQFSGVRRVVSTMRFTTPSGADHPLWVALDDYKKILEAEHCDLILDEVGGAIASSTSDNIPMPVKASLQELRRRDVLCRWTAPSWARASKILRECSQGVTLTMGYAAVPHKGTIDFDGPHATEIMSPDRESLMVGECSEVGPHSHDAGRIWGARRLMFARTYDANRFEEWNTQKRQTVKPLLRSLFWRPGSDAETYYDTHAYVEKLGQVTEGGACMDCGGTRPRPKCMCTEESRARRGRRASSTVLDGVIPGGLQEHLEMFPDV